ncbi:MAG: universal stress protein [Dehalococcoidia bacterium]|nr:universal stress protein [Dehalococcoidia bacterium]
MFNWARRNNHSGDGEQGNIGPSSILVLVTGSPSDNLVVRMACELLESRRSTLRLLYVIEVARHTPLDAVIDDEATAGEQVLEEMERVASRYNCIVEAHLVQARDSGTAVVREAVEKNVEAIAIGTSVVEAFGRYSLEEHVPYILRHAPCRVILCRELTQIGSTIQRQSPGTRAL